MTRQFIVPFAQVQSCCDDSAWLEISAHVQFSYHLGFQNGDICNARLDEIFKIDGDIIFRYLRRSR